MSAGTTPDTDLAYLQQAEAHADEGPLGEPAARSILKIALKLARQTHSPDALKRASEAVFAAILQTGPLPWETTDEGNRACDYIASCVIDALAKVQS